jgi:molybdopterin synthase sulfur carrier subunit
MLVRVRLFAALREQLGRSELELELAPGATADDAWRQLVERQPDLAPRRRGLTAAVNRSYAAFDEPLSAGDELVFIPPVSGG